ncbi:MAG: gliding motility-associated C-terminal domain-containing protein [Bernardetiaceae bacterium]|nr:gliding motility-associated C-terminal domain-containing protein [Bernardetiaceae bacterium]
MMLLAICLASPAWATHIRAGDITARRLPGTSLTYEFTIVIYTDDEGIDPDNDIEMFFGDGSPSQLAPRVSSRSVGNLTTENIYRIIYTFAGPGEFPVGTVIRNRNPGITNIPNSINIPFSVESTFLISPFLGLNASPILTNPPVDFLACVGRRFKHNPGAVDPEGDSLSYRIVSLRRALRQDVNPQFPVNDVPNIDARTEAGARPATLTINPRTGELVWDAPAQPGEYNVAFVVEEWRNGVRIGTVNRDMQIVVRDCNNRTPQLTSRVLDTCVVAGALLRRLVTAQDPDRHRLQLTGFGAPFLLNPPSQRATLDTVGQNFTPGQARATFNWQTTCNDVNDQPYVVTFRVRDLPPNSRDQLADFQSWIIRVIGPPPQGLQATVNNTTRFANVAWQDYLCRRTPTLANGADSMVVYRRVGPSSWQPGPCETGIPASAGYSRIGNVGIGQTSFLDNNGNAGLQPGVTYCYRLVAFYPDGSQSVASREFCTTVRSNAPLITNVSVEQTDPQNGQIFVRWVKPIGINPNDFPRPWTYQVARARGFAGNTGITRLPRIFAENDTSFSDPGLNTTNEVYNYRVYFFSQNRLIDSSAVASSVRLTATPGVRSIALAWQAQTPWDNNSARFPRHLIYRERINQRGTFDLIDSVDVTTSGFRYVDQGRFQNQPLQERVQYCYFVTTRGTYNNPNIRDPLLNNSQRACAVTRDVTPPCPPTVRIAPLDCRQFLADLSRDCNDTTYRVPITWQPDFTQNCDRDVVSYNLYFAPYEGDSLTLLAGGLRTPSFEHRRGNSVAGCYAVTAVDSEGNESPRSAPVCLDNCPAFALPNVITPNGDGRNDTFRPSPCPRFVRRVVFRVRNRWGQLVYEGDSDIFINWRGTRTDGSELPAGVYYYEARVSFNRLRREEEVQTITGWVQIMRGNGD